MAGIDIRSTPLLCDNQRPRTATPWLRPPLNTARHPSTFPGEKLKLSIRSGIESACKGISAFFICIGNGVRSSQQIFPSRINCFYRFLCRQHSRRAFWIWARISFSLSGKHYQWSFHINRKLGLWNLLSLPPLQGWLRGGYLDAFTIGQGSHTGGLFCFYNFLFSGFKKRGTRSNAHRSAESETEPPIGFLIPQSFFFTHFRLFGIERLSRKTTYTYNWDSTFPPFIRFRLCSRFTNDYDDDLFYESMTNDNDFFRHDTTYEKKARLFGLMPKYDFSSKANRN